MDEPTDLSTKKQCAFSAIYFDDITNTVCTTFFDIVEPRGATANDLYMCVKTCLQTKDIPLQNMIGFSSDTTNVMVGDNHSVFPLLKHDMPHIACIKCSCHMIHLAASKACIKLPRSVEDLIRNVGSHFSRSSTRIQKFVEFQQFFRTDIHTLKPSTTRWLSVKACVDRLIEQYEPLKAYFQASIFEDPSVTTEEMLKTMQNQFTKIYLEFMSYCLGLLTDFNLLFQTEKPLLYKIKPETEKLLTILCSNFIEISYLRECEIFSFDHRNPTHFIYLNKIYLGVAGTCSLNTLKGIDVNEKAKFFKTILEFYIEEIELNQKAHLKFQTVVDQIKQRFVFNDPIYNLINIVEPSVARSFDTQTLKNILDRFPPLLNHISSLQDLDEWRQHALIDLKKLSLDIQNVDTEIYWKDIFQLKNSANIILFPNLKKVIGLLLCLPYSNASVERIFSELFSIKNDKRNLLDTNTVKAIIATKHGIRKSGGILAFTPSTNMVKANIWHT